MTNSAHVTKCCNYCGKPLDFWDEQEDFSIIKRRLGYGSTHDGDALELRLCTDCLDRIASVCVFNPFIEADE